MKSFRLAKSLSRLKPYWACILPAKEETEGRNPPKQTTSERGCGESLENITKQQCKSLMTSLSYSYFDVKPKCFQCTNKLKELASPFQQFRRGLYIQLFTFSVRIDLYFTLISRIKYKHKTHHQISVLCHHIPLHLYC